LFGGRKVETRMFRRWRDRWDFASYAWQDDQRDATLVPRDGLARVAEVAPGKWHNIPSHDECRACHDAGRTEVLGFSALQLSDDRDPLAPHAEPLEPGMVTLALVAERRRWPAVAAHHHAARGPHARGAGGARIPSTTRQLPQPRVRSRRSACSRTR
jgi:hypothetical protein